MAYHEVYFFGKKCGDSTRVSCDRLFVRLGHFSNLRCFRKIRFGGRGLYLVVILFATFQCSVRCVLCVNLVTSKSSDRESLPSL